MAAAIALASLCARAGEVTVEIKLAAPGALEVAYTLPDDCARLPFLHGGDAYRQIRAQWTELDDCGGLDGEALVRGRRGCRQIRFRVPASLDKITGYPGAFPVGEGIFAHTSKYAPADTCGKAAYRFVASGSIGLNGQVRHGSAAADGPGAADMPVLLLPVVLAPGPGTPAYFDPRLSAATVARIRQVADQTIAFNRKALPNAAFRMPIMAATLASGPGGPHIGGDGGDVMRLALFNWPPQPGPEQQRDLTLLVAHEFSHRFQLRDEVDSYPDARLIHEGGAEFLRWMASIENGWLTHAEAADELDDALAACLLAAAGKGWRELKPGYIGFTRAEYRCGLAAYAYGLAARQGSGSAFERIDGFYRGVKSGAAPGFAHALECGADAACAPRWLPRLLGKEPMAAAWDALLGQAGLARPAPPKVAQLDAMMQQAVTQLMQDDCAGASSLTPVDGGLVIDGMPKCATLRSELQLVRVEGLPLFGTGQALPALIAACETGGRLRLGMKNGDELVVACTRAYRPVARFYAADIGRLLAGLERR